MEIVNFILDGYSIYDKDLNQRTMMTKYAVAACPNDLKNNWIENLLKEN